MQQKKKDKRGAVMREYSQYKKSGGQLKIKEWFAERRGGQPLIKKEKIIASEPQAEIVESEVQAQPVYSQEMQTDDAQKIMPESELELNYFFTNPQWGEDTVNPELQASFRKRVVAAIPKGAVFEHEGKEFVSDGTVERPKDLNLWGNFSFLTRDVRLANYDNNDITYCSYYYDLGGDFLNEGFPEAAAICIRKAATKGEMSQGRKGFLRKMQNTLISLRREEHNDMSKRSILGGRPKQEDAY